MERYNRPPTRRRHGAPVTQQHDPVAPTPEARGSVAVAPEGGSTAPCDGEEDPGKNSSSSNGLSELASFSDEALERELRRRRRGGGADVGVGAEGGACGQDGGVCVPCFEIA